MDDGRLSENDSQTPQSVGSTGTVLVTGAAGFIGTALVERLLQAGYAVRGMDVSTTWRLEEAGLLGRIEWFEGDIRDKNLVSRLMDGVCLVYHLAAIVGVDDYIQRPREVLDVNITGSRNVFEAALACGVPVVMASTSEVYGKNARKLSEDEDSLFGPTTNTRWSYALSKATSEAYARAMSDEGLVYTIIRYFNVYGPRMDRPGEGRVISKFLGALQREDPLVLVDGGSQVRAFCYVDDAVEATVQLGQSLDAKAAHRGEIVNVGRHEPVSMETLAHAMLRLSGSGVGTLAVPGDTFFGHGFEEIQERVPDLTRLHERLGVRANIDLEEGLTRVLAHWDLLAEEESRLPATDLPWMPMIRPDLPHDHRLLTRIQGLLQSGSVTNDGAQVEALERELGEALGVDDVVLVSSGSAALRVAVHALDLETGTVVLPSFTYIATASAAVHAGLRPVFCDIDPETWTMCPVALERVLSRYDDVRAVISVTAYGVPADHGALARLAAEAGAEYVVDHAHGFGSEYQSQRVPSPARFAAWSLHATKVLPAVEGGFVTSEDQELLARVRTLRRHGLDPENPTRSVPGFNARMDEICAAVGRASLRRAGRKLTQRRATYNRLRNALSQAPRGLYQVQRVPDGVHANGQNLALRWTGEAPLDSVIRSFARHGIEARRYFGPPLHHMPAFGQAAALEVTDDLAERVLCLPLYGAMATHEIERVEDAIAEVASELSETGR